MSGQRARRVPKSDPVSNKNALITTFFKPTHVIDLTQSDSDGGLNGTSTTQQEGAGRLNLINTRTSRFYRTEPVLSSTQQPIWTTIRPTSDVQSQTKHMSGIPVSKYSASSNRTTSNRTARVISSGIPTRSSKQACSLHAQVDLSDAAITSQHVSKPAKLKATTTVTNEWDEFPAHPNTNSNSSKSSKLPIVNGKTTLHHSSSAIESVRNTNCIDQLETIHPRTSSKHSTLLSHRLLDKNQHDPHLHSPTHPNHQSIESTVPNKPQDSAISESTISEKSPALPFSNCVLLRSPASVTVAIPLRQRHPTLYNAIPEALLGSEETSTDDILSNVLSVQDPDAHISLEVASEQSFSHPESPDIFSPEASVHSSFVLLEEDDDDDDDDLLQSLTPVKIRSKTKSIPIQGEIDMIVADQLNMDISNESRRPTPTALVDERESRDNSDDPVFDPIDDSDSSSDMSLLDSKVCHITRSTVKSMNRPSIRALEPPSDISPRNTAYDSFSRKRLAASMASINDLDSLINQQLRRTEITSKYALMSTTLLSLENSNVDSTSMSTFNPDATDGVVGTPDIEHDDTTMEITKLAEMVPTLPPREDVLLITPRDTSDDEHVLHGLMTDLTTLFDGVDLSGLSLDEAILFLSDMGLFSRRLKSGKCTRKAVLQWLIRFASVNDDEYILKKLLFIVESVISTETLHSTSKNSRNLSGTAFIKALNSLGMAGLYDSSSKKPLSDTPHITLVHIDERHQTGLSPRVSLPQRYSIRWIFQTATQLLKSKMLILSPTEKKKWFNLLVLASLDSRSDIFYSAASALLLELLTTYSLSEVRGLAHPMEWLVSFVINMKRTAIQEKGVSVSKGESSQSVLHNIGGVQALRCLSFLRSTGSTAINNLWVAHTFGLCVISQILDKPFPAQQSNVHEEDMFQLRIDFVLEVLKHDSLFSKECRDYPLLACIVQIIGHLLIGRAVFAMHIKPIKEIATLLRVLHNNIPDSRAICLERTKAKHELLHLSTWLRLAVTACPKQRWSDIRSHFAST
ncbi:hypothetical protein BSLG_009957 [Batrachochytrium salamandrivorans]|nr:hypothetical protein BSLG_009957 [Batrachochytrium salamandrivorans]